MDVARTMARLFFTQQLARFTSLPEVETAANHLRAGLESAFDVNPTLRGYVLDDQGHLRENVVIFIDGRRSTDRRSLADPLAPDSKVYILQALSGG
jgi:molybdopterin synthase sulfur carrier subunit